MAARDDRDWRCPSSSTRRRWPCTTSSVTTSPWPSTRPSLSGSRGSFDILSHYGRAPTGKDASLMGDVMSRLLAMRMLSSHPGSPQHLSEGL